MLHEDGSIDAEASDALRASATDPSKTRKAPQPKLKPVPDAAVSAVGDTLREQGLVAPTTGGMTFLQARGVPWGAPVIRALRDLDDYELAEIMRKKTEACVTAIVFGDDESQQGIAPSVVGADGNRVEQFEPGLIAYARGGKDIRFNEPLSPSCCRLGVAASARCTGSGRSLPVGRTTPAQHS